MRTGTRNAILSGLVVTTLLATISIASNVTLPYTFTSGTPAKAAEVNGDFAAVKTAVDNNFSLIGTLQTAVSALTSRANATESSVATIQASLQDRSLYYAMQSNDLLQSATGAWVNVPGASVSFSTTAASTNILMTATGSMHQYSGPATWVKCGLRFVVDGATTGDATRGSMEASVSAGDTALDAIPFAMRESASVGAGSHTVAVQMTRIAVSGVTASGECAIYKWGYSRTHLTVQAY